MALTADPGELAKGFRQRYGRWPNDREREHLLREAVRARLDAELAGRRADPVAYERAVTKIAGRLEKAARKTVAPRLPLADEYDELARTVCDPAAADGFARLAKAARAAP